MKGFPTRPEGPLGPWYRKVNETVARAGTCTTATDLVELLGEPDAEEAAGDVVLPTQAMAALGSRLRFGEEGAERVLTWIDPYRPARRYRFGIADGRVVGSWVETVRG